MEGEMKRRRKKLMKVKMNVKEVKKGLLPTRKNLCTSEEPLKHAR